MSNKIPDFTESELRVSATARIERYGEEVELQLADTEMQNMQNKQNNKDSNEKVDCPVILRHQGASFIASKMGEKRFPARYFYTPRKQFSAAEDGCAEVGDCLLAVPMVQADHQAQKAGKL